jgi:antitoxin VapB
MTIVISLVFTLKQTQVVRLPDAMRLPDVVKRVMICVRGCERIICPIENAWDHFFHYGPRVTEDFMSERDQKLS